MVMVGIYALHRDPALWDNPLVFDPARFSPENSKGRDRWQYLPFGAGPRSCIGDHFAMLEATLGLATTIRLAEIRSLDEDFPLAVPFTTIAAAPIRARVRPRNGITHDSVQSTFSSRWARPRRLPLPQAGIVSHAVGKGTGIGTARPILVVTASCGLRVDGGSNDCCNTVSDVWHCGSGRERQVLSHVRNADAGVDHTGGVQAGDSAFR